MQDGSFCIPGTSLASESKHYTSQVMHGTSLASESKHYAKYASWKTKSADVNCKGLFVNDIFKALSGTCCTQCKMYSLLNTMLSSYATCKAQVQIIN